MPPILKDFLLSPGTVEVIGPLKNSVFSLIAKQNEEVSLNEMPGGQKIGEVQSFKNSANNKAIGATSVLNKLLAKHITKSEKPFNKQDKPVRHRI